MIFFEEEFDLLDAFIGEGQDPVVIVGAVDPDDAVLGLETEGQFLDELFADAEVPGDTFDGVDVMHLIALHDQAAAGCVRSFADLQFHGSSSWIRLAGWSGSRARTSASQACGSMSFSLAVAISVYMKARAVRRDRSRRTARTFGRGQCRAARARPRCWSGRSGHRRGSG